MTTACVASKIATFGHCSAILFNKIYSRELGYKQLAFIGMLKRENQFAKPQSLAHL